MPARNAMVVSYFEASWPLCDQGLNYRRLEFGGEEGGRGEERQFVKSYCNECRNGARREQHESATRPAGSTVVMIHDRVIMHRR